MSERRKRPEDCATMEALRREIDRIDESLFDLFAERMGYIRRAPALKARAGIPADVPSRVQEVVDNARAHAERRGLDPDLFEDVWRALVANAIATEERIFRGEEAAQEQTVD